MKILIVDDVKRARAMIRSILGDLFSEIYECRDRDKAVELFFKNQSGLGINGYRNAFARWYISNKTNNKHLSGCENNNNY